MRHRRELDEEIIEERLVRGERRLRVLRRDRVDLERHPHHARELGPMAREELLHELEHVVHLRRGGDLAERVDEIDERRALGMKRAVRERHRRGPEACGRIARVTDLPVLDRVRVGRVDLARVRRDVARAREDGERGERVHRRLFVHRTAGREERLAVTRESRERSLVGVDVSVEERAARRRRGARVRARRAGRLAPSGAKKGETAGSPSS